MNEYARLLAMRDSSKTNGVVPEQEFMVRLDGDVHQALMEQALKETREKGQRIYGTTIVRRAVARELRRVGALSK